MSEYTPDEAALKAEIEALAQNIHPDADFVANLEAQLMRNEAMASARFETLEKRISLRYLALVAAMILVPLGIIYLLSRFNENDVAPTEISQNDIQIAVALSQTAISIQETQLSDEGTAIAMASTPTGTSTATQTTTATPLSSPTQFSPTLISPIRSTSTALPSATPSPTPLATSFPATPTMSIRMTATAIQMTATPLPKPTEISSVSIEKFLQQLKQWLDELLNWMNFSLF